MKQMIILTFILMTFSKQPACCQNSGENYIFKDGVIWGPKQEMIKAATSIIPKEMEMYAGYDVVKTYDCIFSFVCANYTSEQVENLMTEHGWLFMAHIFSNEANSKALMDCLVQGMDLGTNENASSEFYTLCREMLKPYPAVNVEAYCNCVTKSLNGALPEEALGQSAAFDDCLEKSLITRLPDFNDGLLTGSVQLEFENGTYSIAVSIGTITENFTLDSGAGTVMITADMERELLMDQKIDRASYLPPATYQMADGTAIECRRVLLNAFKIGDFTLNNVLAAVMETKGTTMLLGGSVLKKFSHWKIDNTNKKLILNK